MLVTAQTAMERPMLGVSYPERDVEREEVRCERRQHGIQRAEVQMGRTRCSIHRLAQLSSSIYASGRGHSKDPKERIDEIRKAVRVVWVEKARSGEEWTACCDHLCRIGVRKSGWSR